MEGPTLEHGPANAAHTNIKQAPGSGLRGLLHAFKCCGAGGQPSDSGSDSDFVLPRSGKHVSGGEDGHDLKISSSEALVCQNTGLPSAYSSNTLMCKDVRSTKSSSFRYLSLDSKSLLLTEAQSGIRGSLSQPRGSIPQYSEHLLGCKKTTGNAAAAQQQNQSVIVQQSSVPFSHLPRPSFDGVAQAPVQLEGRPRSMSQKNGAFAYVYEQQSLQAMIDIISGASPPSILNINTSLAQRAVVGVAQGRPQGCSSPAPRRDSGRLHPKLPTSEALVGAAAMPSRACASLDLPPPTTSFVAASGRSPIRPAPGIGPGSNFIAGRSAGDALLDADELSLKLSPTVEQMMGITEGLIFTAEELPHGMRRAEWHITDYIDLHRMHKGYASSVFKATCTKSNSRVVLKVYHLKSMPSFLQHQAYREVDLHSRLAHPNIIALYASFKELDYLVLVFEYAKAGDLQHVMAKLNSGMPETTAVQAVLNPLLKALQYIHSKGIVHRDIKPDNILFDATWTLKLADFGVSIDIENEAAVTCTGTASYMAPEVQVCPLKRKPEDNKGEVKLRYTPAVDVWSVGVLAYEILVGFSPDLSRLTTVAKDLIASPQHTQMRVMRSASFTMHRNASRALAKLSFDQQGAFFYSAGGGGSGCGGRLASPRMSMSDLFRQYPDTKRTSPWGFASAGGAPPDQTGSTGGGAGSSVAGVGSGAYGMRPSPGAYSTYVQSQQLHGGGSAGCRSPIGRTAPTMTVGSAPSEGMSNYLAWAREAVGGSPTKHARSGDFSSGGAGSVMAERLSQFTQARSAAEAAAAAAAAAANNNNNQHQDAARPGTCRNFPPANQQRYQSSDETMGSSHADSSAMVSAASGRCTNAPSSMMSAATTTPAADLSTGGGGGRSGTLTALMAARASLKHMAVPGPTTSNDNHDEQEASSAVHGHDHSAANDASADEENGAAAERRQAQPSLNQPLPPQQLPRSPQQTPRRTRARSAETPASPPPLPLPQSAGGREGIGTISAGACPDDAAGSDLNGKSVFSAAAAAAAAAAAGGISACAPGSPPASAIRSGAQLAVPLGPSSAAAVVASSPLMCSLNSSNAEHRLGGSIAKQAMMASTLASLKAISTSSLNASGPLPTLPSAVLPVSACAVGTVLAEKASDSPGGVIANSSAVSGTSATVDGECPGASRSADLSPLRPATVDLFAQHVAELLQCQQQLASVEASIPQFEVPRLAFPASITANAVNFVTMALQPDPLKRPTVAQMLSHAFIMAHMHPVKRTAARSEGGAAAATAAGGANRGATYSGQHHHHYHHAAGCASPPSNARPHPHGYAQGHAHPHGGGSVPARGSQGGTAGVHGVGAASALSPSRRVSIGAAPLRQHHHPASPSSMLMRTAPAGSPAAAAYHGDGGRDGYGREISTQDIIFEDDMGAF